MAINSLQKMLLIVLLFVIVWTSISDGKECIPRDFRKGSVVCVCNSTYCDSTPETTLKPGTFLLYTSSKSGERMNLTVGRIGNDKRGSTSLRINSKERYQEITGFGGAFTDSAGINIKNISEPSQRKLLETYFGKEGSRYNFGRVPIGGTDFSTRFYTYDDFVNDEQLQHFSLAPEDRNYKIPLMQQALELNPELRFVSAAWTPPVWMKTNNKSFGHGFLRKEYYQLYADYLLKFLDEYKKQGLEMWTISTGNEPSNIYFPIIHISSLGWKTSDLSTWVAKNLGPSLATSQHKTQIITLDDQRFRLPYFTNHLFKNNVTRKYVSGIAVHWYWDAIIPPSRLDKTHNNFPEKFLLITEACEGAFPWQLEKVKLGDWDRAESYVLRMFENFNHWITGWIDWNLALDKIGGPNWIRNFVDSPVIVNPETDEFFKQPLYYVIHHFSRFLPRGSVRLDVNDRQTLFRAITSMAFETPQNETVVLIYNSYNKVNKVDIIDERIGIINLKVPALSMNTIVYKSQK